MYIGPVRLRSARISIGTTPAFVFSNQRNCLKYDAGERNEQKTNHHRDALLQRGTQCA
jgi:hypothetical protein